LYTNLNLLKFGTNLNFASNAGWGMQYFFNQENSINLELRYFHFSNTGIDSKTAVLIWSISLSVFLIFLRVFLI
jgi:hypothetical protein